MPLSQLQLDSSLAHLKIVSAQLLNSFALPRQCCDMFTAEGVQLHVCNLRDRASWFCAGCCVGLEQIPPLRAAFVLKNIDSFHPWRTINYKMMAAMLHGTSLSFTKPVLAGQLSLSGLAFRCSAATRSVIVMHWNISLMPWKMCICKVSFWDLHVEIKLFDRLCYIFVAATLSGRSCFRVLCADGPLFTLAKTNL